LDHFFHENHLYWLKSHFSSQFFAKIH
jgi:hypothetical protein